MIISDIGAILTCIGISVVLFTALIIIHNNSKIKKLHKVISSSCIIVLICGIFLYMLIVLVNDDAYRYREVDLTNENNKFKIVYDAQYKDESKQVIEVSYLTNDFQFEEVTVGIKDVIIGTTVATVNIGGNYEQYIDIGPITIEKNITRNLLVLNKHLAIKLGLIEATGSADEKPFDFGELATPSEITK